jgi:excisionase family DNA binding protein
MADVKQGADAEPIIPIAEAARLTGIPYHTLLRLVREKRIACVRVSGIRRIRLSQVEAAIEEIGVVACA